MKCCWPTVIPGRDVLWVYAQTILGLCIQWASGDDSRFPCTPDTCVISFGWQRIQLFAIRAASTASALKCPTPVARGAVIRRLWSLPVAGQWSVRASGHDMCSDANSINSIVLVLQPVKQRFNASENTLVLRRSRSYKPTESVFLQRVMLADRYSLSASRAQSSHDEEIGLFACHLSELACVVA